MLGIQSWLLAILQPCSLAWMQPLGYQLALLSGDPFPSLSFPKILCTGFPQARESQLPVCFLFLPRLWLQGEKWVWLSLGYLVILFPTRALALQGSHLPTCYLRDKGSLLGQRKKVGASEVGNHVCGLSLPMCGPGKWRQATDSSLSSGAIL